MKVNQSLNRIITHGVVVKRLVQADVAKADSSTGQQVLTSYVRRFRIWTMNKTNYHWNSTCLPLLVISSPLSQEL